MLTPRRRRPKKQPPLGRFEVLETRIALDADGLIWGDAPYLTLSFADDGTDVDGVPSRLYGLMNDIGSEQIWKAKIISAFETWAIQTNGDVAEVDDDGSPFGTDGESQGDPRFGDVRVGAIPMRDNVFGVAVTRGFVAGTWSGDVLFNANAEFANLDEVFRVALHEAGHTFGFEDNDDPTSVMFDTGIPTLSAPSPADLDELWSRFGQRAPDIHELNDWNDVEDNATHMSSSDSFDGTTPIILHADIGTNTAGTTDQDYYRFDPPDDPITGETYLGPVTMQIRTAGLSQLDPQIEVIREEDHMTVVSSSTRDEDGHLTISFELTDPLTNGRHFVVVRADDAAASPIGSYALVATLDNLFDETLRPTIDVYAGPQFRFLDGDQIQDLYSGLANGSVPLIADDLHMNDTVATATPLEPLPGFEEGAKYRVVASISDQSDVDIYQFESVDLGPNSPNVVSILVDNFDGPILDANVELLGPDGTVLTHTNLLHHDGRTLIQLTDIAPSTTHYVRVAANEPSEMENTGNYRLSIVAGSGEITPDLFVSATAAANLSEYTYRAPRPQLVTFAFDGSTNTADAVVMVTLSDLLGKTVHSFNGRINDFFTADSVMLERGIYRVRVMHGAVAGADVDFEMFAAVITDPLAVPRHQTGNNPIVHVPEFNDVFVFPDANGPGPGNLIVPPTTTCTRISRSAPSVADRSVERPSSVEFADNPWFDVLIGLKPIRSR